MEQIKFNVEVATSRKEYTYAALSPSEKAYVATTMSFLDLESTPARRDNLARLMFTGAWEDVLQTLKNEIDSGGVDLRGT